MKKIVYLLALISISLFSFSSCNRDENEMEDIQNIIKNNPEEDGSFMNGYWISNQANIKSIYVDYPLYYEIDSPEEDPTICRCTFSYKKGLMIFPNGVVFRIEIGQNKLKLTTVGETTYYYTFAKGELPSASKEKIEKGLFIE